VRWAQDGMKTDPNQYNEDYSPIMMDYLEFLVDKYSK